MLSHGAVGDLIGAAHNEVYQRLHSEHSPAAVALGCGQLRSGVGWLVAPLPSAGLHARHAVVPVERLPFGHHRIRQMQQLARGTTARDLRRLAGRAQALVVGLDPRLEARRPQARQLQGGALPRVTSMTDLGTPAHATTGLAGQRHEPNLGGSSLGGCAGLEIERADQQPGGGEHSTASHAAQQTG
jgi:hypothetical protein